MKYFVAFLSILVPSSLSILKKWRATISIKLSLNAKLAHIFDICAGKMGLRVDDCQKSSQALTRNRFLTDLSPKTMHTELLQFMK